MITLEQYHYLKSLKDFENFTTEQFDKIAEKIRFHRAKRNHTLFYEGDNRDTLFLVVEGYVKLENVDSSGTFIYTDYVRQDTIFPYGRLFSKSSYQFSAIAITDISYFAIPMCIYEEMAEKNTLQMKYLCIKYSKLLEVHAIRLRNTVTSSAKARTIQSIATLILIANLKGDGDIPFPLTISDIANLSGTRRETSGYVLRELMNQGIIEMSGKTITILNYNYFEQYLL